MPPRTHRGTIDAERVGNHDAANIRTRFWNFGMVGDYPPDPINVDLSTFHSAEVPRGSGMNYTDGITPFVLARDRRRGRPASPPSWRPGSASVRSCSGRRSRSRRRCASSRVPATSSSIGEQEPRPLTRDQHRSPHLAADVAGQGRPDDLGRRLERILRQASRRPSRRATPSWTTILYGYSQDWAYHPDANDPTRGGLGLRIEVRGFQWANPQAGNVIFWHYDITNESTTAYNDSIFFGLYMDSGVGGSAVSCDGVAESDDDNATFDRSLGLNLVYTFDKNGHGRDLSGNCGRTGYLGYAYLETPGNPFDRARTTTRTASRTRSATAARAI